MSVKFAKRALLFGLLLAVGVLLAVTPVRRTVTDASVSVAAAALGGWISRAHDRLSDGATAGIPPVIARQICGDDYDGPGVLPGGVHHRIGWDRRAWISAALFQHFGQAVTLGDLIVFRDETVAANPVIWVHELAHVRQYARWGIDGFAYRYVRDAAAVERAAWAETTAWAERSGAAGGC